MIKVYNKKVLIEVIRPSEEDRGFIVPDSAIEEPTVGVVRYTGEKVENTEVGDIVVFGKFDTTDYNVKGTVYKVCEEESLICKIEQENE